MGCWLMLPAVFPSAETCQPSLKCLTPSTVMPRMSPVARRRSEEVFCKPAARRIFQGAFRHDSGAGGTRCHSAKSICSIALAALPLWRNVAILCGKLRYTPHSSRGFSYPNCAGGTSPYIPFWPFSGGQPALRMPSKLRHINVQ